jgi:hypothetical protein
MTTTTRGLAGRRALVTGAGSTGTVLPVDGGFTAI